MKYIKINELNQVNPEKDIFVIKNVVKKSICADLNKWINFQLKNKKPNTSISSKNNWFYRVNKGNTYFSSFILNEFKKIKSKSVHIVFEELFKIYLKLGLKEPLKIKNLNQFRKEFYKNELGNHEITFHPYIFSYDCGTGKFAWHSHKPVFQKFQLLLNTTMPNKDYFGGETDMIVSNKKKEVFGDNFQQGDIFSFPYHLKHRVRKLDFTNAKNALNKRNSILMPIHPKSKKIVKKLTKFFDNNKIY